MDTVIQQAWEKGMSYQVYRDLVDMVVSEGKTTGPTQSDDLAHFTKLNASRMKRLDRTMVLNEELLGAIGAVKGPQAWLLITEAWCGDAAQIVPILAAMVKQNPLIELRLILRDENLEVMDRYLTRGGRSIPKLVVFDQENGEELFSWGPRPSAAQEVRDDLYQQNPEVHYSEVNLVLQKWYNHDKGQQTQRELLELLAPISVP